MKKNILKFWSIYIDESAIFSSKMDPQRNSDHFPFFYFQNPTSGSKVSPFSDFSFKNRDNHNELNIHYNAVVKT